MPLPFWARTLSLARGHEGRVVVPRSPGTRTRRRAHSLRAHVRAAGEFGELRAGRVDLREHGRVRGLLGESRADDAVDDAEALAGSFVAVGLFA
jgi:hypothetical protein